MGLNKDLLVFDTADTAGSDNVGAYVRSDDGTLITHHTVGSDEALDVYIANDIAIDVDGVYDAGDNPDPDNVGLIAHTRAATPDDDDQVERVTSAAASSDDVVAANVHGLDVNSFLMGFDGTTWDRVTVSGGALDINFASQDAAITVTNQFDEVNDDDADAGGSLKVGGRAIDQSGALTALSAAGDRGDLLMDLYRRVFVADYANIASANEAVTVGTTETAVPTANLAGRKSLILQNQSNSRSVYVGPTGVTTADGLEIPKRASLELQAGEGIDLFGITASSTAEVRVFELA